MNVNITAETVKFLEEKADREAQDIVDLSNCIVDNLVQLTKALTQVSPELTTSTIVFTELFTCMINPKNLRRQDLVTENVYKLYDIVKSFGFDNTEQAEIIERIVEEFKAYKRCQN